MANVSKIKLGENVYNLKDDNAARKGMYVGTCSTAAATAAKVATTDTFPLDEDDKPLVGTVIAIKFANSNSYKTEGTTMTLNVNGTGAFPIYYNNAEVVSTTSANTSACGYKNRYIFYTFNGTQWVWLGYGIDANSTYSTLTLANLTAGIETTGRLISAKLLRDNFYLSSELDILLDDKVDLLSYSNYATMTSDTPEHGTIGWDNDNENFYIYDHGNAEWKPIDKVGAQSNWNETDTSSNAYIQNKPTELSAFTNDVGYLTSYTETDPTVPSWAKQSTKPTYTASEVGAMATTHPANAITSSDIEDWNDKADKIIVTRVTGSGSISRTILPGKFYIFPTLTGLTLTLGTGQGFLIYGGKFTADLSGCTLTLPSGTTVAPGCPSIEGGNTYEFNILEGSLILALI